MKGKIFIAWSGENTLARSVKDQLALQDYVGVVGGESGKGGGLYVGDVVLREIMGGCVTSPPNFGEYEFNHALDPEAFAFCARFPHAAITLDTCRVPKLDMRRYEITGDDIHARILRADQRLSITRHEEGCYVWDDVAACYLLYPERFRLKEQTDPHGNRVFNAEYVSDELYFTGE